MQVRAHRADAEHEQQQQQRRRAQAAGAVEAVGSFAALAVRSQVPRLVLLAGVAFNTFVFVLAITTLERDSDETPTRQETRQRMTGDDRAA